MRLVAAQHTPGSLALRRAGRQVVLAAPSAAVRAATRATASAVTALALSTWWSALVRLHRSCHPTAVASVARASVSTRAALTAAATAGQCHRDR